MAENLVFEHSIYVGTSLLSLLYGVQVYMYTHSVYLLLQSRRRRPLARNFYIAFSTLLLVSMTLTVVSDLLIGRLMWIDHRDVRGGPLAYYREHMTIWFETMGSATSSTANLAGDGLLIYRAYMIWGSKVWVLLVLLPLYLTNIALAVISLVKSALPGAGVLHGLSANYLEIWTTLAVAINLLVTLFISTRLLIMRHQTKSELHSQMTRIYTSVIAIVVESALPYSIAGVAFIVLNVMGSPASAAADHVFSAFCCLSPQLIIVRITMGLGWNKHTERELTTLGPPIFASPASLARQSIRTAEAFIVDGKSVHTEEAVRMQGSSGPCNTDVPDVPVVLKIQYDHRQRRCTL